jgi:hypothetical protein
LKRLVASIDIGEVIDVDAVFCQQWSKSRISSAIPGFIRIWGGPGSGSGSFRRISDMPNIFPDQTITSESRQHRRQKRRNETSQAEPLVHLRHGDEAGIVQ